MKTSFIILIFLSPLFSNGQWDVVHCGPIIYNLDFVNDSTGYVLARDTITMNQLVLKTTNYGTNWDTVYTTNGALQLMDLSFPTEEIGYVSGGGMGYILKTIDGGETWVEQDLSEVWEIGTIEFQNESDGYGGNSDGYIAYVETHDGGETWEYNLEMGLRDVSIFNDCDIVMPYGGGYYANENCLPWFTVDANFGSGGFSSIEKTSPSTIFMGGLGWDGEVTFNYGIIARSLDNGESFDFIEYPFLGTIYDMQFTDSNTGYAVTTCQADFNPLADYLTIFLKTIDGGETWNYQEFTNDEGCNIGSANHLSCISEQVCYATGSGRLFRTMNGGGELHPMPVGITEYEKNKSFEVYPNPTDGKLQINSSENSFDSMKILNSMGQLVSSIKQGLFPLDIDVSQLNAGIYFIEIQRNGEKYSQKIVKK